MVVKRSVTLDLADAADAIESLEAQLKEMSFEERIDVAARLNTIAKGATDIVDVIKDDLKKRAKEKDRVFKGESFTAETIVSHPIRLDQAALRAEAPGTFSKYTRTTTQVAVLFKPR